MKRWSMIVGMTTMTSGWSADRDEESGFDHMAVICDLIRIRAKIEKNPNTTIGIEKVQAVKRDNYLDNFWYKEIKKLMPREASRGKKVCFFFKWV